MPKQIQIPEELYIGLILLLDALEDETLTEYSQKIIRAIQPLISAKEDALARRAAYSAYRTAPQNSVQREKSRQKYLDITGVQPSYRTAAEVKP
jgi:hypothetical protein